MRGRGGGEGERGKRLKGAEREVDVEDKVEDIMRIGEDKGGCANYSFISLSQTNPRL